MTITEATAAMMAEQAAPEFAVPAPEVAPTDKWWQDFANGTEAERTAARENLITHFAPLATHVASRMIVRLPDSVELADLVSYGMFGLIDAVEKFEPERGFKFETYAATRVRGAIIDELRAADWVPRSVRSKARSVEHAARALEQSLLRNVTDDDVAEQLGWETREVRNVRAQVALSHIAALDSMTGDSQTFALDALGDLDANGASQSLETRETHALLASAVQSVRDREQQVLKLYYYENLTLAQIGQILGVTESRVSQIHSGAVKKLRESLTKTGAFS